MPLLYMHNHGRFIPDQGKHRGHLWDITTKGDISAPRNSPSLNSFQDTLLDVPALAPAHLELPSPPGLSPAPLHRSPFPRSSSGSYPLLLLPRPPAVAPTFLTSMDGCLISCAYRAFHRVRAQRSRQQGQICWILRVHVSDLQKWGFLPSRWGHHVLDSSADCNT